MTVPYERMRSAERVARNQFPEATLIRALWTPTGEHEIAVEIWHGRNADVLPVVERA